MNNRNTEFSPVGPNQQSLVLQTQDRNYHGSNYKPNSTFETTFDGMNGASVTSLVQNNYDPRMNDQSDFQAIKVRSESPIPKLMNPAFHQHKRSKSDGTDMLKHGSKAFNIHNTFNILLDGEDINDDSDCLVFCEIVSKKLIMYVL